MKERNTRVWRSILRCDVQHNIGGFLIAEYARGWRNILRRCEEMA